jgi:hypothetical protein
MVRDIHILLLNARNVELGSNLLCRKSRLQNAVPVSTSIAATLTLVPSGESLNSTLRGTWSYQLFAHIYRRRELTSIAASSKEVPERALARPHVPPVAKARF